MVQNDPLAARILESLAGLALPGGGRLGALDAVRALAVDAGKVRFVLDLPAERAGEAAQIEAAAEAAVRALPGVAAVSIATTVQVAQKAPPSLKIGRHQTAQEAAQGPAPIPGVRNILAVASGKGGVGKSTLAANLAVALARQGRRVGLLDADIHGPSQPRMMGVSARPETLPDKRLVPLVAHGVRLMSLGLLVAEGQAVVWRGPMLMGALQQMLNQVDWGPLDVLLIDLPPGTGDVQLTLCQKTRLTGALVVSTPQDVALLDARRAIDMFARLKAPVLGLVENMSVFICPNCGHEAHVFGHGGVRAEAAKLGLPFLGEVPLDLDIRLSGDSGVPVAAGEGPIAAAYARLAEGLVQAGLA